MTRTSAPKPRRLPGVGWGLTRASDLAEVARSFRLGYPSSTTGYLSLWLLAYGLLFPLAFAALGRRRAEAQCRLLLDALLPPATLPLPSPLDGRVCVRGGTADYYTYFNMYREDEYRRDLIGPGMRVVDVGAHIGLYSLLAAKIVGSNGSVIAVEPEPGNFDLLSLNVRTNGLTNVRPLDVALADRVGTAALCFGEHTGAYSLVGGGASVTVPVTTLDVVAEEHLSGRIDLLKIDVEGAEMAVLRGGEKTIHSSPKMKCIVASYHYPSEAQEVREFLADRGFSTEVSPAGIVFGTRQA